MSRKIRDTNLETREARRRLAVRPEPHWRLLDRGLHLGYRRIAKDRPGTWTARRRAMDGRYAELRIGAADDYSEEDGLTVLAFSAAQHRARDWAAQTAREDAGLAPRRTSPYTVADAVGDYLKWFEGHRKSIRQTREAAERYIIPALGACDIAKLTTPAIKRWHEGLAAAPARVRSAKGRPLRHRKGSGDDDGRRKRRATANRNLTVIKAALNHAWREGHAASDDAWRRVKPFRAVDAPVIRYLTDAECARLVNAASPEFRPMVRAALLTGCRYGELAQLRAADFNPDAGTLLIRTGKAGRPRHVILTDEGRDFLASAVAGKAAGDLILTRPGGAKWGPSHQQRPMAEACKRAKIAPAVSFHVLRHTHGSLLAMRGVPMAVIAKQLGHADTRMTEKHYAHLSPSYVADTIRASFPTLGIVEAGKLRALR